MPESGRGLAAGVRFLTRNFIFSQSLKPISAVDFGEFCVEGLLRPRVGEVDRLHRTLRNGRKLGVWRHLLYTARGARLVVISLDSRSMLVGFDMYYWEESQGGVSTVHEAFIGVSPHARDRGLATEMRRVALTHFAASGVQRVTTDIASSNKASRVSAERSGFCLAQSASSSTRMYRHLA